MPVFNGGPELAANVATIQDAVADPLGHENIEVVVVSDGSIDGSAERLIEASRGQVRVIHYDRNLGKGYAVKAGILAARGSWVGICDSDLDLDPAALPRYVEGAIRDRLDLAIGSKRHPDSIVHYPWSRRAGSWGYQQLNRILFGLSVRDTQVGLKVLSRDVADNVVPLLLVKRFAFDLEMLAVAHALGYRRIRELPIQLDYRFTGSEVRSRAVVRALWDTVAVFYRLRVLRTYQRKRTILGRGRGSLDNLPSVALVDVEAEMMATQDYPRVELGNDDTSCDLVAIVGPGARPAGNWLSAAVPFFHDPGVVAVVCPTLAPLDAPLRARVAAAVLESRLGSGSRRERYLPGNLREVDDFPGDNVVVRQAALQMVGDVDASELIQHLARHGRIVYTPETVVVAAPPPALRPLLAYVHRAGASRGRAVRDARGRTLGKASTAALAPVAAVAGVGLLLRGGERASVAGGVVVLGYVAAVVGSATLGALQFRQLRVGALAAPSLVATQVAYLAGFVRGLTR